MKRVIVLIVCLILCSFASGSIAEDPLRIQPGDSGTEWRIVSQTNNGLVTQGSSQLYTSYTATCTGETHGVTVSKSYSASISGSFGVSLSKIEASLGFQAGEEFSVSATTTSAPLNAGDTVEIYWTRRYQKTTVVQQQYAWEIINAGTDANPILKRVEEVIDTKTAYGYKPVAPEIKLVYYRANSAGQRYIYRIQTLDRQG